VCGEVVLLPWHADSCRLSSLLVMSSSAVVGRSSVSCQARSREAAIFDGHQSLSTLMHERDVAARKAQILETAARLNEREEAVTRRRTARAAILEAMALQSRAGSEASEDTGSETSEEAPVENGGHFRRSWLSACDANSRAVNGRVHDVSL